MRTVIVKLGGQSFKVTAMNLGQLEEAMPSIMSLRGGDITGQFKALLDVLQVALGEDYPDVNVRKLNDTLEALKTAFTAIIELSGFEMKAPASGEAPARATPSTSKRSAAA
jgi:hypothetical protein